jgi:hypothetical protein
MLPGSRLSSHNRRSEQLVSQQQVPQRLLIPLPLLVLQRVTMKAGFHPSIFNDLKLNVFDLEPPRPRPSRMHVKNRNRWLSREVRG